MTKPTWTEPYRYPIWAVFIGVTYGSIICGYFPDIDAALIFGGVISFAMSVVFIIGLIVRSQLKYSNMDRVMLSVSISCVCASFVVSSGVALLVKIDKPQLILDHYLNNSYIMRYYYEITTSNFDALYNSPNAGYIVIAYFAGKPINIFIDLLCCIILLKCVLIFYVAKERTSRRTIRIVIYKTNAYYIICTIIIFICIIYFYILLSFFNFDLNAKTESAVSLYRRQTFTLLARPVLSFFFVSTVYIIGKVLLRAHAVYVTWK